MWDEHFFKLLGSKFGSFLDFDEATASKKRFDVARVLVSTARMGFIDELLRISVVGAFFNLWVVEDKRSEVVEVVEVADGESEVASDGSEGGDYVVGEVVGDVLEVGEEDGPMRVEEEVQGGAVFLGPQLIRKEQRGLVVSDLLGAEKEQGPLEKFFSNEPVTMGQVENAFHLAKIVMGVGEQAIIGGDRLEKSNGSQLEHLMITSLGGNSCGADGLTLEVSGSFELGLVPMGGPIIYQEAASQNGPLLYVQFWALWKWCWGSLLKLRF